MTTEYRAFLEAKARLAQPTGLHCEPEDVHPLLKPHQRDSVVWAVRGGRRAVFAAFGLGKTFIQLEVVRIVLTKLDVVNAKALVLLGIFGWGYVTGSLIEERWWRRQWAAR